MEESLNCNTLFVFVGGGEEWKLVSERLGQSAREIRFLEVRLRNPCEAALLVVSQRRCLNEDDLCDMITECEMPMLADIL